MIKVNGEHIGRMRDYENHEFIDKIINKVINKQWSIEVLKLNGHETAFQKRGAS